MGKIRVLVVDDSAFMRKLIPDLLSEEEKIEVIGTARNGQDAVKKVELLNPDVITMDVEMPIMNGLEALKKIMKQFPKPVIMLSSTTKEGAQNAILSLQDGAFDFIAKPSGAISLDLYKVKEELIKKVLLAKSANIGKLQRNPNIKNSINKEKRYSKIDSHFNNRQLYIPKSNSLKSIVCIGTSTGGPRALQQVLPKLPADIDVPIFIVQHMPSGFTESLANRLNSISRIIVKEARHGEEVKKGVAYIAPGGSHLKVQKSGNSLKVILDKTDPRNGHRPSVDELFEALSELPDYRKIAVILTGMGSDGTEGLKKLKLSGAVNAITESEQSSIVFGMPKSAQKTNLVDKVEHLDNIAASIMEFIRK
ncbi:chemotaxis response regulator protein-glutamate methylesterase [uncultured Metabacillus sp.]|uniref:protein-glutamate methylesterase/protein-glutamine glutaminase n=1 Tax=uncultured Metabacillus sp. TaxID=2860135 RepID=UPI0026169F05|nr:chemotaxis response regulator protein-glutamate methylesterase [uncultured Metabacillus sp.]